MSTKDEWILKNTAVITSFNCGFYGLHAFGIWQPDRYLRRQHAFWNSLACSCFSILLPNKGGNEWKGEKVATWHAFFSHLKHKLGVLRDPGISTFYFSTIGRKCIRNTLSRYLEWDRNDTVYSAPLSIDKFTWLLATLDYLMIHQL